METDKKLKEKLLASLEIPSLTLKDCPRIELSSNTHAEIEGCKGITEYSDERVSLNLGCIGIIFKGSSLEIRHFNGESVIVSGNIICIEFC